MLYFTTMIIFLFHFIKIPCLDHVSINVKLLKINILNKQFNTMFQNKFTQIMIKTSKFMLYP